MKPPLPLAVTPQHEAFPSSRTTHVCWWDVEIETAVLLPNGVVNSGVKLVLVDSLPNRPESPLPQQATEP